MSLILETTLGGLPVNLYVSKCPMSCYNFMKLCKAKYYDMVVFHSVIKDFVAQTGDPTGTGCEGTSIFGLMEGMDRRYYVDVRLFPEIKHDRPGLLSMVHCGNNQFGSQFLITLGSDLRSLDGEHLIFGEIYDADDVLLKFNEALTNSDYRPYKDIRITHITVLLDPFEKPEKLIPGSILNARLLKRACIPLPDVDSEDGLTEAEKQEKLKDKEAKAQATILEIVGDLPSYDVAPPENVLFVCRLNPNTREIDLEIIFSRFGKIISVEIIRDRKTGDSLQYAFIEFENKESCENAYMKMEGVLIDERRIHVDFSQSVAKRMKWNGKGKGVTLSAVEEELREKEKRMGRQSSPGRDSAGCSSWDMPRDSVSRAREINNRDKARTDEQKSKEDKRQMDSRKDNRREGERHDSQRKNDSQEPSKWREDPREQSKRREDPRELSKRKEDPREISKCREDTRESSKRGKDTRMDPQESSKCREDPKVTSNHREDPKKPSKCREDTREFSKRREDTREPSKFREDPRERSKRREDPREPSKYREDRPEPSKCREEPFGKSSNKRSQKGKHYEKQKHVVHDIIATSEKDASQSRTNKRRGSESSEEGKSSYKDNRSYGLLSREYKKPGDKRSEKEMKYASKIKGPKRHDSDEDEEEIADRRAEESNSKYASGTKEHSRGYYLRKNEKESYASQLKQSKISKAKRTTKSKKMKFDESEKEYVNKRGQKKKQASSSSTSSDTSGLETPKEKTAEKTRKSRKALEKLK